MFKDPIVEETRKAGYLLAAEVDFDQRKFIDKLRNKQYSSGRKPVPPPPTRSHRTSGISTKALIRFGKAKVSP
jgi:hypothetical protein